MAATTRTALLTKLNNRKSKRDIEREIRIEFKNGIPIDITYGKPLSDDERADRIVLETQLNNKMYDKKCKDNVLAASKKRKVSGAARTEEQYIKQTLKAVKRRAEIINVPFNLTIEDLAMPEFCPVFDTKLFWTDKLSNDTPSLDRLIPELGYIKGNVCFISMKANRLKNNATLEELQSIIDWMKKVGN
jgi:hypothetical protein